MSEKYKLHFKEFPFFRRFALEKFLILKISLKLLKEFSIETFECVGLFLITFTSGNDNWSDN